MAYGGRPGISPALAPLLATGAIRKNHLILDVGCGTGNDCILLARWGFRRVVGIHADPQAVRIARGRATRARLGKRVRFLVGGPGDLPPDVTPARVNIVLHTLVGNNLEAGFDAHYRAIWRAMKPTGFLIECDRTDWTVENARLNAVAPVRGSVRYFDFWPGVSSHLAERSDRRPGYAPAVFWFGIPRRRPRARAGARRKTSRPRHRRV